MIAQAEQIETVSNALIKEGVMGVFIIILLVIVYVLWKEVKEQNKYIREQQKSMTEVLGELTSVVDNVYQINKDIPENVKAKLDPSLERLHNGISSIRDRINEK